MDAKSRMARMAREAKARESGTPARAAAATGSDSEDVVDLEYIHANKPPTKVVREFMRVQASAVSAAANADDFL